MFIAESNYRTGVWHSWAREAEKWVRNGVTDAIFASPRVLWCSLQHLSCQ
jgi:hypothetical protein